MGQLLTCSLSCRKGMDEAGRMAGEGKKGGVSRDEGALRRSLRENGH
jgi:hypothetical protein